MNEYYYELRVHARTAPPEVDDSYTNACGRTETVAGRVFYIRKDKLRATKSQ